MGGLRRLETEKISKLLIEFSIPAIVGSLVSLAEKNKKVPVTLKYNK